MLQKLYNKMLIYDTSNLLTLIFTINFIYEINFMMYEKFKKTTDQLCQIVVKLSRIELGNCTIFPWFSLNLGLQPAED